MLMQIHSNIPKKVGVSLDQHQPKKLEKSMSYDSIVYDHITKKLKTLSIYTHVYGITLTFKKSFKMDDPQWLHRHIHIWLNQTKWKKLNYILFPEFTSKGDLHYHGVVWDCYQAPFLQRVCSWQRKFGFVKPELQLNTYHCGLPPKQTNKCCWYHYIIKDHGKTGLCTLTNYKV